MDCWISSSNLVWSDCNHMTGLYFKLVLDNETFSWNLHVRPVSWSGVTRWNSCFYHHFDRHDRCRSRKWFYFSWNLSHNGNSKKFHKTDHVTQCNASWNLFCVAHKFHLKVSMCNSGFIVCFCETLVCSIQYIVHETLYK